MFAFLKQPRETVDPKKMEKWQRLQRQAHQDYSKQKPNPSPDPKPKPDKLG